MSSEHQSDSEDADESRGRPHSGTGSDKDEDPDIDDSDVEGDIVRVCSPPPIGDGDGQADASTRSPGEGEPGSAPRSGSGGELSSDSRGGGSLFSWLQGRATRRGVFVDPARDNYRTMTSLYCSMNSAVESVNLSTQTHGAVFNLEYSPDGSVLTVACEQTEVLLFDPISFKHFKTLTEAHEDCVNNIRFLDNRLFATCSDDTTIALWDLRKLNSKVCSLQGHASWVKNIEYDTNTRLLVTSGFDGNVITWDMNRFTEDGCPYKKFFHTRYLMRMRLTPDCSKMVLTPEIPGERDRGNCITSLQLHPKGWATLIRCSSNTDDQEWTCVYEFQEGAPTRLLASPRCSLRLTHYIEEANVGRGYIKELCFSPDGRLICSPYGYGVRLLAFDEKCGELADCLPVQTSCLREMRSIYSHSDVVLTTKFSPTHCQLASGCLSGRVALYQPKF
eukprot:XP_011618143.1 PREDICTED: LOW QUALITY PROTEIN: DDB1- and CUL4-associated factor 10 [Takifugu rubripes]